MVFFNYKCINKKKDLSNKLHNMGNLIPEDKERKADQTNKVIKQLKKGMPLPFYYSTIYNRRN